MMRNYRVAAPFLHIFQKWNIKLTILLLAEYGVCKINANDVAVLHWEQKLVNFYLKVVSQFDFLLIHSKLFELGSQK